MNLETTDERIMPRKTDTHAEPAERPLHGEAHIPEDYGPDDMRQGEIVLRTKGQRALLYVTLAVGLAILAVVSVLAAA